jgi:Rhodococcus equi virulence-associated protein
MNVENTINKQIVNEYEDFFHGSLMPAKQNNAVKSTKYLAKAPFNWVDFSYSFTINFYDANICKSFEANIFGMGGALNGTAGGFISTENLERLFSNTVSYHFNGTESDFIMNFFDENSNLLGNFKCENFVLFGVGGGVSKWLAC